MDEKEPAKKRLIKRDEVLFKRLRVLIFVRAFFVTLLLGSFYIFNIRFHQLLFYHGIIYLIITLYAISIIYLFLLRIIKDLYAFAYIQLIVDAVVEILLIYLTGGIESWFTSIMLLTVMVSPIILNKRAGFTIATILSILYGTMLDLQYYGVIGPSFEGRLSEKDFLYNIFTHILALYLTAYLTGFLVSRLEKTTKKLEEKDINLQDLTIFNRELIESLPSGLITTDSNNRIIVFNKAAEIITGLKRTDLIGRDIRDVFPFLKPPFEVQRREITINPGGEEKIIGFTISETIKSDGRRSGHICIFQDITNLKRLEAELSRKKTLATIGELSAYMAHEIRNPLASLKGAIELLKENRLEGERRERLMSIALNEMDRLNKIITDFLMYSNPSPPEYITFDLHGLLRETLDMVKLRAFDNERITIKKDFADELMITADPQKLRQVFINLANNALESMLNGGELKVSTIREGEFVSIKFEDTGLGIAKEDLERIFLPFYTTKEFGTGLGLSIVYRIIQEHNGNVRVESILGKGTTFEIELPINSLNMREGLNVTKER